MRGAIPALPKQQRRGANALVTLSLFLVAGCDPPGKPNRQDAFVAPDKVTQFAVLYEQNCAGCHGKKGNLGPAPPLNDELFQAIVPPAELLRVIRDGRAGTPMPAFAIDKGGTLTMAQVKILAEGVKTQWGGEKKSPEGAPAYVQRKSGDGQAGMQVFARACAGCHGPEGKGDEKAGAINELAFLALISDQALRRYAITGRPDLGMPNYAEPAGRGEGFKPLTDQEVTDLVALLAWWRLGGSGPPLEILPTPPVRDK